MRLKNAAAEEWCDHAHDADKWTFGSVWVSWLCDKKEAARENGEKVQLTNRLVKGFIKWS